MPVAKNTVVVQKAFYIELNGRKLFNKGIVLFVGEEVKSERILIKAMKCKSFDNWSVSVLKKMEENNEYGILIIYQGSKMELKEVDVNIKERIYETESNCDINYTNYGPLTFIFNE
ncbi:hypothetical protein NUSPORA_01640 [Nucleospora cyclopteri]